MAKLSRSTLLTAEVLRIRGEYGNSRLRTRMFAQRRSRCRNWLGSGDSLDHNAKCWRRSALVSRRAELAVLIGEIDAASPRPHLAASIAPVRIASSARRATSGKSALTVALSW
jgi:hypothetical protein